MTLYKIYILAAALLTVNLGNLTLYLAALRGLVKILLYLFLNSGLDLEISVAKTLLLKASVRHVPNSRYESGQQHSSGRSLTAIIAREEDSIY
jgi:hypothetical protein